MACFKTAIIVDDISIYSEPFFQVAGPVDTAIESAVAGGVSYFSAAGLDPGGDGALLTTDDSVIGGVTSVIKSIYAKSADTSSHFVAGAFKHAALPKAVKTISADPRFLTV